MKINDNYVNLNNHFVNSSSTQFNVNFKGSKENTFCLQNNSNIKLFIKLLKEIQKKIMVHFNKALENDSSNRGCNVTIGSVGAWSHKAPGTTRGGWGYGSGVGPIYVNKDGSKAPGRGPRGPIYGRGPIYVNNGGSNPPGRGFGVVSKGACSIGPIYGNRGTYGGKR